MYSITKNGQCAKHLCVIDEKAKSVSTTENGLVFDFTDLYKWSFKTGGNCTFDTGYSCTFNTGSDCTFNTDDYCTFNTGNGCTFNTGSKCTFDTSYSCTFNTGYDCTFKASYNCTFDTGYSCTFNTGSDCTFKTGDDCTFKVGEKCVLVRIDDVFEIIILPQDVTYRLNGLGVPGGKVLTKEYVQKYMNNEEGLALLLESDPYIEYPLT